MGDETYLLASPGHAIPVDEKVYVCTDELVFPDGFCKTGSENVSRGRVKMCAKKKKEANTIKNGISDKTARIDRFVVY